MFIGGTVTSDLPAFDEGGHTLRVAGETSFLEEVTYAHRHSAESRRFDRRRGAGVCPGAIDAAFRVRHRSRGVVGDGDAFANLGSERVSRETVAARNDLWS